ETRRWVVKSFDSARRGIELALAGSPSVTAAPTGSVQDVDDERPLSRPRRARPGAGPAGAPVAAASAGSAAPSGSEKPKARRRPGSESRPGAASGRSDAGTTGPRESSRRPARGGPSAAIASGVAAVPTGSPEVVPEKARPGRGAAPAAAV